MFESIMEKPTAEEFRIAHEATLKNSEPTAGKEDVLVKVLVWNWERLVAK